MLFSLFQYLKIKKMFKLKLNDSALNDRKSLARNSNALTGSPILWVDMDQLTG